MLNIQNCKTGQLVQKLELCQEGLFEVTKALLYVVTLRLPANIKIFNTFHVSMVRLYQGASIEGQHQTNSDVRANRGRVVIYTNDNVKTVEQRFERIIDFRKADNSRQQYLVKWEGYDELTQQLATDLRGCDNAIWVFYNAYLDKPEPLAWVPRRQQRHCKQGAPRRWEAQGGGWLQRQSPRLNRAV